MTWILFVTSSISSVIRKSPLNLRIVPRQFVAQKIARDIQCKAAACVLGGSDDERDETTDTDDLKHMDDTGTSFATVGVRNKKRSVAAGGVKLTPQKKPNNNEELLQYVGTMTKHLC